MMRFGMGVLYCVHSTSMEWFTIGGKRTASQHVGVKFSQRCMEETFSPIHVFHLRFQFAMQMQIKSVKRGDQIPTGATWRSE